MMNNNNHNTFMKDMQQYQGKFHVENFSREKQNGLQQQQQQQQRYNNQQACRQYSFRSGDHDQLFMKSWEPTQSILTGNRKHEEVEKEDEEEQQKIMERRKTIFTNLMPVMTQPLQTKTSMQQQQQQQQQLKDNLMMPYIFSPWNNNNNNNNHTTTIQNKEQQKRTTTTKKKKTKRIKREIGAEPVLNKENFTQLTTPFMMGNPNGSMNHINNNNSSSSGGGGQIHQQLIYGNTKYIKNYTNHMEEDEAHIQRVRKRDMMGLYYPQMHEEIQNNQHNCPSAITNHHQQLHHHHHQQQQQSRDVEDDFESFVVQQMDMEEYGINGKPTQKKKFDFYSAFAGDRPVIFGDVDLTFPLDTRDPTDLYEPFMTHESMERPPFAEFDNNTLLDTTTSTPNQITTQVKAEIYNVRGGGVDEMEEEEEVEEEEINDEKRQAKQHVQQNAFYLQPLPETYWNGIAQKMENGHGQPLYVARVRKDKTKKGKPSSSNQVAFDTLRENTSLMTGKGHCFQLMAEAIRFKFVNNAFLVIKTPNNKLYPVFVMDMSVTPSLVHKHEDFAEEELETLKKHPNNNITRAFPYQRVHGTKYVSYQLNPDMAMPSEALVDVVFKVKLIQPFWANTSNISELEIFLDFYGLPDAHLYRTKPFVINSRSKKNKPLRGNFQDFYSYAGKPSGDPNIHYRLFLELKKRYALPIPRPMPLIHIPENHQQVFLELTKALATLNIHRTTPKKIHMEEFFNATNPTFANFAASFHDLWMQQHVLY